MSSILGRHHADLNLAITIAVFAAAYSSESTVTCFYFIALRCVKYFPWLLTLMTLDSRSRILTPRL
jgi:hypothetical protein